MCSCHNVFYVISAIFMVNIVNNIAGTVICFFVPATHFFACKYILKNVCAFPRVT